MDTAAPYLQLDSVRLSDKGASYIDGGRATLFIPRAEIVRLELVYGSAAERPIVTIIVALLLFGVAILPLWMLVNAIRFGLPFPIAKLLATIALAIPAVWLLDLVFRRRWLLVVHMAHDRRKLAFRDTNDAAALQAFLDDARRRFGYGG